MMGMAQNCISWHKNRHLIISMQLWLWLFFLLMVPLSTSLTQGRSIPSTVKGGEEEKVMRELVGSRPPRCERIRCGSCRKCEAIQVPVGNTRVSGGTKSKARRSIAYSRGDDFSNYKPISWKCKCGDLFFDP